MRRNEGVILAGKIKALFGAHDMTHGSPTKRIVEFSIPLLIGNVAQLLYSTVDSIIVGKYVGDGALAAIGVSGPIIHLLLLLFMGIATGSSIMVSQYFGAKEREKLSNTVGTTMTLTMIVTIIMMALGYFLSRPILSLLSTPQDVFDMASNYLIITFLGIIGPAFYNMIAGILRGLGDSIMPLIFLVIACFINIGLDLYFVSVLGWGVEGAAFATVIAQFVSAALCVIKLIKVKEIDIGLKRLKPNRKLTSQLIRLGLPSGLTQGIFSLAMLVVQRLTNSFGTTFMAVSTVVMRVDSFAMMPNFTFGTAMTTYAGQNIGAGRIDRVKEGTKRGLQIALAIESVLVLIILLFGGGLMTMFTDSHEVIDMGTRMLRVLALGYMAVALSQVLMGVMRGAGETMVPMWISIITTVFTRIPVAYGLVHLTKSASNPQGLPEMVYVSLLISWVLGAILSILFYRHGKWTTKGVIKKAFATGEDIAEENAEIASEELPVIEKSEE